LTASATLDPALSRMVNDMASFVGAAFDRVAAFDRALGRPGAGTIGNELY
jgi:hypothetical protein